MGRFWYTAARVPKVSPKTIVMARSAESQGKSVGQTLHKIVNNRTGIVPRVPQVPPHGGEHVIRIADENVLVQAQLFPKFGNLLRGGVGA